MQQTAYMHDLYSPYIERRKLLKLIKEIRMNKILKSELYCGDKQDPGKARNV